MTEHYCQKDQEAMMEGISQIPDFTCEKGEEEQPKAMSEVEEVMSILNDEKDDGESVVDCLKRIVSLLPKYKKAS